MCCHVNLLKKYFERDQRLFPPVNVPACNLVDISDPVETESVSPRTPLLSSHQSCELNDLLSEFDDIFSEEPGKTHLVEHHIKLTHGATPRRSAPYRLSQNVLLPHHIFFCGWGYVMRRVFSSLSGIFFVVFAPPCICPQTRPLVLRSVQRD